MEEDPRADWPDALVFGFVPSQEVAELQDDVDTFAQVLSDALGIEVEGIVTTDYTGLGVALGTGQADLGAFGPAGYVLANQTYDNLELLAQSVRFGDPTYHGQWFTNDPSICDGDPSRVRTGTTTTAPSSPSVPPTLLRCRSDGTATAPPRPCRRA
jgi:phosphonate transport system substrate-binding protein